MALAKPARASDQVAALIGIQPVASDPGQPIRLALNKEEAVRQAAAEPIGDVPQGLTSTATVELPPAAAGSAEPVAVAPPSRSPAPDSRSRCRAEPAPAPIQPAVASAKPARRCRRPRSACRTRCRACARPPRLARRQGQEPGRRPARRLFVARTRRRCLGQGLRQAWLAQALYAGHRPLHRRPGHRLSPVGQGLRQHREAASLCASLKRAGRHCFVRSSSGDAPVQFASR